MSKTLLYRLFKAGEIPKKSLPIMEREVILFQEEGITNAIHFRKFRAPGRYYGYKITWGSGSIVLTKEHFLAFRYSEPVIGVTWKDIRLRKMDYYIDDKSRLCIAYDASTFNQKWSGNIEVKYSSERPQDILRIIDQKLCNK